MKRYILSLLILALVLCLALPIGASDWTVSDEADIFTSEELLRLQNRAMEASQSCGISITLLTVNSLEGVPAQKYADDWFDAHILGSHDDCLLLVVSLTDREYAFVFTGEADRILRGSVMDEIEDRMVSHLRNNRYYEAFLELLRDVEEAWAQDAAGTAFTFENVLVGLVIGLITAGITVYILCRKMNTARAQSNAGEYMVGGSYDLYRCHDMFLYSRVTKTRRSERSSSSSSRSGGGRSGRSGRF